MTHPNIIEREGAITRQLETRIGNLTHHLLSISDPTRSAQIAADLIATIEVLVYARGGDLS